MSLVVVPGLWDSSECKPEISPVRTGDTGQSPLSVLEVFCGTLHTALRDPVADTQFESCGLSRWRFYCDYGGKVFTGRHWFSRIQVAREVLVRLQHAAADNFLPSISKRDVYKRVGQRLARLVCYARVDRQQVFALIDTAVGSLKLPAFDIPIGRHRFAQYSIDRSNRMVEYTVCRQ